MSRSLNWLPVLTGRGHISPTALRPSIRESGNWALCEHINKSYKKQAGCKGGETEKHTEGERERTKRCPDCGRQALSQRSELRVCVCALWGVMFALLSASVGGFCGCRFRNWVWSLRMTVTCKLLPVTCYLFPATTPALDFQLQFGCGFVWVHYKLKRHSHLSSLAFLLSHSFLFTFCKFNALLFFAIRTRYFLHCFRRRRKTLKLLTSF